MKRVRYAAAGATAPHGTNGKPCPFGSLYRAGAYVHGTAAHLTTVDFPIHQWFDNPTCLLAVGTRQPKS